MRVLLGLSFLAAKKAIAINFPFESTELTPAEVEAVPGIAFGDAADPGPVRTGCRFVPGDSEWPTDEDWSRLNGSLGGALLRPDPLGAVCYPDHPRYDEDACLALMRNAGRTRLYIDDPLTVLTAWTQGETCPAALRPRGTCERGGFPEYVVNASTVAQMQMAVNFARNKGLRLVIKNTGHDFNGRSTGKGALSIWTHFLKEFEYLPDYSVGDYHGPAARVSAGLEAWEMFDHMKAHDMTLVVPGGYTVGAYGGWMAAGGHSPLASTFGLGSDQVLSLEIITADGRFATASPEINQDLFYALRGGGPSTYGIVTSAIVKAHPAITVTTASLRFQVSNGVFGSESDMSASEAVEAFWTGVGMFFHYGKDVTEFGGTTYNYVTPGMNNASVSFRTDFEMPGMTPDEVTAFLQPLYDALTDIGIPISKTVPGPSTTWGPGRRGIGDMPGNSRLASRLFPRRNWGSDDLFDETMAAVRTFVEGGYSFHGIHMGPTEEVAGYPGGGGVNPAFRETIMHADLFDRGVAPSASADKVKEAHDRLVEYVQPIRDVTEGSGAYMNEGDVLEPDWQRSYFGAKYERLLAIKQQVDPWNLFWAPGTVGSEPWAVRTTDGLPTQNGVDVVTLVKQRSREGGVDDCLLRTFFAVTSERWPASLKCLDEYHRIIEPLEERYFEAELALSGMPHDLLPVNSFLEYEDIGIDTVTAECFTSYWTGQGLTRLDWADHFDLEGVAQ